MESRSRSPRHGSTPPNPRRCRCPEPRSFLFRVLATSPSSSRKASSRGCQSGEVGRVTCSTAYGTQIGHRTANWPRFATKGPRTWVEYPLGKSIYEQTETSINAIRVSPDGKLIALLQQMRFGGGDMWLSIVDRAGVVTRQSQKWASTALDSLAWTPDGKEVWFTAAEDVGLRGSIHAMTLDGDERIVHRTMGSVRIADIAPDGRALLIHDAHRASMSVIDQNAPGERDLTWRNWSRPRFLSNDGKTLLFVEGAASADSGAYLRQTDGSPAILLGKGDPIALSPDGKWAVVGGPAAVRLTILPTGVGETRTLEPGSVVSRSTFCRWLPDGRLLFVGNTARQAASGVHSKHCRWAARTCHTRGRQRTVRRVTRLHKTCGLRHEDPNAAIVPARAQHSHRARWNNPWRPGSGVDARRYSSLGGESREPAQPDLAHRRPDRPANILAGRTQSGSGGHRCRVSSSLSISRRQQARLRLPETLVRPLRCRGCALTRASVARRALSSICAALCLVRVAAAQSAVVNGRVLDEHGRPVAGATVTLANPRTGLYRGRTDSNNEGLYRIAGLPAGLYDVAASLSGFTTAEQHGVVVRRRRCRAHRLRAPGGGDSRCPRRCRLEPADRSRHPRSSAVWSMRAASRSCP